MHIAFDFTKDFMNKKIGLCLHRICGLWQTPWFILSFLYLWKFTELWNFVLVLFCQLDENHNRNFQVVLLCCNNLFVSLFFEEKRLRQSFLIFLFSCNIFFVYFFDLKKLWGKLFANFLGLKFDCLVQELLGDWTSIRAFYPKFQRFWMRRRKRKIVNLKGGLKIYLVVLNFENGWEEKEG
jgi:hypothetical protein